MNEHRSAVLVEARRWIGTPYHHMGRVKGVGADCATFPAEVYAAVGVIASVPIAFYPQDWHLHRGEERYLAQVLDVAREVVAPEPGDLALWRIGRAFAHGAIVIAWPRIVHAAIGLGVIEDDASSPSLAFARRSDAHRRRDVRFFSPWNNPPS